LDAQFFGLAQRRRRVFVLARAGAGSWQAADALLPVIESVRWHPAPRRASRERTAPTLAARTRGGGGLGTDAELDGALIPQRWPAEIAPTLNAAFGEKQGLEDQHALGGAGLFVPTVAHALRGEGFDASEDGTERGTPLVPVAHAFDARQSDVLQYGDRTGPLDTDGHSVAVAFDTYNQTITGDTTQTLCSRGDTPGGNAHLVPAVQTAMQVRRLTPRECERLQGFQDGYTAIPWRSRPASECPDGPRYRALGNSMAVPVMRYLGERIAAVEGER
jgi:DNA (cytosine-5)-methyltransferase 1